VPDGWTKPPPAFKSVPTPPGKGGTFTSLMGTTAPPIVPHDQNDYWKELEKRLNVKWDATLVPAGTFEEKFTALLASNSLPDIINLNPPPPGFGRLVQQGAFTDLTPFVTGDALKEYPNLALYDPRVWKIALYAKKTMGVPRPRYFVTSVLLFRQDWAEKVGLAQIKTADDLFNCFVAFTKMDPDGNGKADTFGLTTTSPRPNFAIPYFNGMYRGANNWKRNSDGTLVKDIETEEYKQAVAFARRLWEAGAYHPDAATMTVNNAWDAYIGGKVGAYMDDQSSIGYGDRTRPAARLIAMTPTAKPVALAPFGFDGGKGTYSVNPGANSFAVLPARVGRDPERVKELLRVLNYLGAPFGSEEWRMLQYGIEGVHHTLRADGALVRNDKGEAEKNDLPNLTSGPRPFYFPDVPGPEPARSQQKIFQDHLAVGVDDPTIGLNSPTLDSKGAELTMLQADRTVAIVTGREPLAAWDQFVKDWRSRGGDMIRKEFEADLKG
jgi:putative aldouronate transport system substrate-binding protein